MPTFRATSKIDGTTQEYASTVPDAAHLGADYTLEELTEAVAQPGADEVVATIYGGRRSLSKIEFRRLFPADKRPYVDEFNATFEAHPALTADQKRDIRSGLEDYRATDAVNLDDIDTQKMIGLYVMLGILTTVEATAVLNG